MENLLIIPLIAILIQTVVIAVLLFFIIRMQKGKTAEVAETESTHEQANNAQDAENDKKFDRILRAIENNEFKMYLQFIVDNGTKCIISAEALSRWDHPEEGIVGPGRYIGIMEESGLISKHDYYMFDLACRQLEQW
jgi:predicted signal transduction protein with EAL and GGDEF domain